MVYGFSTITEYMEQRQNFGSTVGRYIGRILNARFTLDGVEQLVPNNGKSGHISHGGNPGFADRIWKVEQADTHRVRLSYLSPDGRKMVSPETWKVTLVYSLGEDDNALDLTYEATTDAPTVLNLSHHSF